MNDKFACGKCGSKTLYREDDVPNNEAFICCVICGNRWPGGVEPVKVNHNSKETEKHGKEKEVRKAQTQFDGIQKEGEKRFLKVCSDCGELKRHHGRGLCSKCYPRRRLAGTLPPLIINRESAHPAEKTEEKFPEMEIRDSEKVDIHPRIILIFDADDIPLYEDIMAASRSARRDPVQHILWILQNQIEGR